MRGKFGEDGEEDAAGSKIPVLSGSNVGVNCGAVPGRQFRTHIIT